MGVTAVVEPYELIDDNSQIAVQAMADQNQILSVGTCRPIIQTTGALTAQRTLTLPSTAAFKGARRVLDNQCSGAFAVKISPATGDLATNGVANGKIAEIYCDGTNWRRISTDVTP
jgi:hypothetical protein